MTPILPNFSPMSPNCTPSSPNFKESEILKRNLILKSGFLGRAVLWHKGDKNQSKINKIGMTILKIIEIGLLCLSIIGLVALFKGIKISQRLDCYKKFGNINSEPPAFDKVEKKTKTQSFNHFSYYAIHNGQLWYKLINPLEGQSKEWKMFYFDGMVNKRSPKELEVDGANLVVVDDKRDVHYKKVVHENIRERKDRKTGAITVRPYNGWDKTSKDNWKDSWFSLPVICFFVNAIHGKRLRLPEDCIWSISHRGNYTLYYKDTQNYKHNVTHGVTTLYLFYENKLYFADPWLPYGFKKSKIGFNHEIKMPKDFIGQDMDTSASTIFIKGIKKNHYGTEEVKMYTRMADFDTLARNPFLKYTNNPKKMRKDPSYRAKKPEDWKEQPPIQLKGLAKVEGKINIIQTGEGNNARKLIVPGTDEAGTIGYYFKSIVEREWNFQGET
jgi:hypothetical protein